MDMMPKPASYNLTPIYGADFDGFNPRQGAAAAVFVLRIVL